MTTPIDKNLDRLMRPFQHEGRKYGRDRHDEDGTPYLAYFRNDVNTGFIWDGNIEHPIQVTREMGEPVVDTFDLPDLGDARVSVMTLFAVFKNACDDYVAGKE